MHVVAVTNVALNKPASQCNTYADAWATKAVDGRLDTVSCTNACYHPWLAVDLEAEYDIASVTVTDFGEQMWGNYRMFTLLNQSINQE